MKAFGKLLVAAMALGLSTPAFAWTDVSDLFLRNNGFDEYIDYDRNATGNVAQEILDVKYWNKTHEMDYTIVGTYEFGTKTTFNSTGRVPEAGYDGSKGCLALSTGWESSLTYTQTITIPAGSYMLQAAWYNGSGVAEGTSLVKWNPTSGKPVLSTLKSFPDGWTVEELKISVSQERTGDVQIGFKAAPNGSANSAKVVLDFIKLMMEDSQAVTLIKDRLADVITEAEDVYGDGSGEGADVLKTAIDNAKRLRLTSTSTYVELHDAYVTLKEAMENYQNTNASDEHPIDITTKWIQNNSFENGTVGWDNNGMQTQTNIYFTAKDKNTYLEAWVNRGERLGDVGVTGFLTSLPVGKYRMAVSALHIQQSGAESTTNAGNPQTGANLFAGAYKTPVSDMDAYYLDFAVVNEDVVTDFGVEAKNPTGNWLALDNFRLYYRGVIDNDALAGYLRNEVAQAEEYLALGIQDNVKTEVDAALATSNAALNATPLVEQDLRDAIALMEKVNLKAAASRKLYDNLQTEIDYAEKVVGWWSDLESKATGCAEITAAVATAKEDVKNYALSDEQLTSAVETLKTYVAKVDKGIYESYWAVGTGEALNDWENEWCYQRSIQSKHWILYWDKGYGNIIPSGLDNILSLADGAFECYANELGYLTINEGKSKTDKYKMIIRLHSSTEWEANGSGIDDTIGMLTLSRWAYTSRGGQTLGHEIGHCFQYQVHCDNGNQNGWMYNWSGSQYGNVFWEMCAQWQAYKYFPEMQFNNNEWLNNTLNGFHKNPFDEELRYNNFFIQDYMCHKQNDIKFLGRLWNESRSPEDPLQAYMRITMGGKGAEQIAQLGDEMWEYAARLTTFDFDHLNELGKNTIGKRSQTAMTAVADDYFLVKESNCVENYGNNAIRLRAPQDETIVAADFVGLNDTTGYRQVKTDKAGWRIGFVAYKNDGTRYYGNCTRVVAGDGPKRVYFKVPGGCDYLWFVVSGAPTAYWSRGWDGDVTNDEQWPYRVRFRNTNLIGRPVIDEDFSAVDELAAEEEIPMDVYSITGVRVRTAEEGTEGLQPGLYIIGGKKVLIK